MNDVTVPPQIQAQMDAAHALQSQLYRQEPPANPVPQTVTEAEPEAIVAEPPVEPTPTEVQPVAAPPVDAQPAEDWQQKYKTLKGMYDAEVPRMHRQLKDSAAEMAELRARLEQVERRPEAQPENTASVSAKDVEDFGQDLMNMVQRVAAAAATKAAAELRAEFTKERQALLNQMGNVQQAVVKSESDKFWDRVIALVPDWKQVDADKGWIGFLNTTPEFSTETYMSLASKAVAAGDAEKVANLVKLWRGYAATPPAPPKPEVSPELRRQVAPSTARSSTPPAAQKTYTREEYESLFDVQKTRGLTPAKLEQLQAEAQVALAEGRVRW